MLCYMFESFLLLASCVELEKRLVSGFKYLVEPSQSMMVHTQPKHLQSDSEFLQEHAHKRGNSRVPLEDMASGSSECPPQPTSRLSHR